MRNENYQLFKRFRHELHINLNEKILNSHDPLLHKALLSIGRNEYHYHSEMYIDVLINTLYFDDYKLLDKYIKWRHRTYHYRSVETQFFLEELYTLKEVLSYYIDEVQIIKLSKFFTYLEDSYKNITLEENGLSIEKTSQIIFDFAIDGKGDEILKLLHHETSNMNEFCYFYDKYISQVIRKIGYEWESTKVSVAKEHLASATLSKVIDQYFASITQQIEKDKTILIATAPNEHHNLGLKIALLLLQKLGYNVVNISSEISIDRLKDAMYDFAPYCVIMTVTLISNLEEIDLMVRELRREIIDDKTQFFVAGNALSYLSDSRLSLGVDEVLENFTQLYNKF